MDGACDQFRSAAIEASVTMEDRLTGGLPFIEATADIAVIRADSTLHGERGSKGLGAAVNLFEPPGFIR